MTEWILDASALLAMIQREPGHERIEDALLGDASMSVVNAAEVISKLITGGVETQTAIDAVLLPYLTLLPLDTEIALRAGVLHGTARRLGLSLADTVCIETARAWGATALTTDRAWLDLADDIEVIR